MEYIKKYNPNRILALVIMLMIVAGIFSIDFDKLLAFYSDPQLSVLLFIAFVVIPIILFFGFSVRLFKDKIVSRSNVFLKKSFDINEISHILYQPTWRGISSMDSKTNMRSLHIVRKTGGWKDTITLANGAYREEDMADIALKLQKLNPRIELDEYAQALVKKHAQASL